MQFLRKIIDIHIESSIHVALTCFALVKVTEITFQIQQNYYMELFAFFGTIVGYNFVKYDELARVKKVELTNRFKGIIAISFLSFVAAFYCFSELKITAKLFGISALLITVLYTLPFFPMKPNMRNWSGVKIYLVAIAWVVVTVVLPVVNADVDFSLFVILKCLQQFVFIFVLMLIFEIADVPFDDKLLNTIPQKIGVKNTKFLSYFLLIIFCMLELFEKNLQNSALIFVIAIIIAIFLYFSNSKRNKYYTSFWVESVPIFWLVLLLVFG